MSLDRMRRGLGQVDRPERVPVGYVRVERDLGVFATDEEADMAAASFEAPPGALASEVTQNSLDEGVQVTAAYWEAPPATKRPGWVFALAGLAVGMSALGVGLAIVQADRRKR